MQHPLIPAPLTPAIEQAIGAAPMVPLTAETAGRWFTTGLYLHQPHQADMGLTPWLSVTVIGTTFCGTKLSGCLLEDKHGYTHTLKPLDAVYVTREAFEHVADGQEVAA